jgi:hypothetical protein
MPFQAGARLPAERASKLGHLDVLKSPLVKALCESFEDPKFAKPKTSAQWTTFPPPEKPLSLVFGVDGSLQVIESEVKPHKALGFVKTALVSLDQKALDGLDKDEPHPFAVRDILEKSQLYHATVFPLRYVQVPQKSVYHAIREVLYDSVKDPSLDGQIMDTLKWLAYEKWDPQNRSLPAFDCPHCRQEVATLPFDAEVGKCPACSGDLYITDMLGFHQIMAEDSAPDSVASDYMGVHETLLLFTGVRYFWENNRSVLADSIFIKDGPLSIRAQYSKLVNPIRNFLNAARAGGVEVCILGQEKSGAFWDHWQLIGDDAPVGTYFVPSHDYIREEIQHRPVGGANYGKDTNYGAKVFLRLDERHKFVLNIPNGDRNDPQNPTLIGIGRIVSTLPKILSTRFEDALMPVEMAHSVASLSTYPSARVLSMFAEASKVGSSKSAAAP